MMSELGNRRSALRNLAARAASGAAALGLTARAGAATRHPRESLGGPPVEPELDGKRPMVWRGKADSVTLSPHPDGKPDHYRAIVFIRNGVSMLDRVSKREQKTDHQLHSLLRKRNSRGMDGRNLLVIKNVAYQLLQSDHDPASGQWTLELRRSSGSAPKVTGEYDQRQDLTGCGCGCNKCCYTCFENGYRVKDFFCAQCGGRHC